MAIRKFPARLLTVLYIRGNYLIYVMADGFPHAPARDKRPRPLIKDLEWFVDLFPDYRTTLLRSLEK